MPTTFTVLPLGNFATDVDPDESNFDAENISALVGQTFGSAANPLSGSQSDFATLTPGNFNAIDQSSIGGNDGTNVYNQSNIGGGEHYFIDGVQEIHDSTFALRATVTYVDGTVLTDQRLVMAQSTNGNVYIVPNFSTTPLIEQGPIESITFTSTQNGLTGGLVADLPVWDLSNICFTRGTLIDTPTGPRPIEDLRKGDLVLTVDHGPQPIRWISSNKVSAAELAAMPKRRPIRIKAGSLAKGVPQQDLTVSPQHRILLSSKVAERMFGSSEILVAATKLLGIQGVSVVEDNQDVEYFHFMFDNHEIVSANGAPAESLLGGPVALSTLTEEAREEVLALFPELADPAHNPQPARPLVQKRKKISAFIERVQKRQEPVLAKS